MKDFDAHAAAWRDPRQVVSQWSAAGEIDPSLLAFKVRGGWWETLEEAGITLLVSRETEHLVLGLNAVEGRPAISYLRIPHPSGIVVDRDRAVAYLASTRNPNQIFVFGASALPGRPLMPIRSEFYPGSMYIHDLALIGEELHANAVGQNAIVRFIGGGRFERVWWPRSIDSSTGPRFERNYLQLNSIAAGEDVGTSYFSASAAVPSRRRPGHLDFPVDRRGVIFDGTTREPVVRGLTRPHSARIFRSQLWVDDSGYGAVGPCVDGSFEVAARLPGWTRGLTFTDRIAFVGTSHVIERYRRYAPGIDPARTACGVHAVDTVSGRVRGSITWPSGNQVFAIDWLPVERTSGFPFRAGHRPSIERDMFYQFELASNPPGSSQPAMEPR